MENERKDFDFKTWAIKYGLKRGTVYVLQKESCCSEDNLRKLTNMEIDNFDISKAQKQVLGRAINELVEGGIQRESFEFSEGQFTNEVDAAVESPTEEPDKPIEPEETQEKPVEPEDQDKDQDEGEEISPEPEKENVAMDTAINPEAASHQDDDQETQKARRKKVSKNKGNFLILHINFCSLKKKSDYPGVIFKISKHEGGANEIYYELYSTFFPRGFCKTMLISSEYTCFS